MSSQKVLFIGAAHVDRIGRFHSEAKFETSNPGHFTEHAGGAALNTAAVFSLCGIQTHLYSRLGDDGNAVMVKSFTDRRGIDFQAQIDHRTATYTALLDSLGDLILGLADMEVYDRIDVQPVKNIVQRLNIGDLLFLDANLPETAIKEIVGVAPCPLAATTVSVAKSERLKSSMFGLDILFTNRSEASTLFDLPKDFSESSLIERINSSRCKNAVVTDGAQSVLLISNGVSTQIAIPTVENIVDVTGAGDALAAGVLIGRSQNLPMRKSVELGITLANKVIGFRGPWNDSLIDQPLISPV